MTIKLNKTFVQNCLYTYSRRKLCTAISEEAIIKEKEEKKRVTQLEKMEQFFVKHEVVENTCKLPKKYLKLKRVKQDAFYLICDKTAKKIVQKVLPYLKDVSNQNIAEANCGLGLITKELLNAGVKHVRMYENVPEFRDILTGLEEQFPNRCELITKNIWEANRYAYMDRQDRGNRVDSLLSGVERKAWSSDPILTVIGTISNLKFPKYLIQSLAYQTNFILRGRVQIFGIMRPCDYIIMTSSPENNNCFSYQMYSVLFNLIFDVKFIETLPRNLFLPWETEALRKKDPYSIDLESLYLVQINLKKNIALAGDDLLMFFYFVKQFYGKGRKLIIPNLEKWVPNCGQYIIAPKLPHEIYNRKIDMFTQFVELTPMEILGVFREVKNCANYKDSPLKTMMESNLLKSENVDNIFDHEKLNTDLEKRITEDITNKLNID